jgi:hypothetical protein
LQRDLVLRCVGEERPLCLQEAHEIRSKRARACRSIDAPGRPLPDRAEPRFAIPAVKLEGEAF